MQLRQVGRINTGYKELFTCGIKYLLFAIQHKDI